MTQERYQMKSLGNGLGGLLAGMLFVLCFAFSGPQRGESKFEPVPNVMLTAPASPQSVKAALPKSKASIRSPLCECGESCPCGSGCVCGTVPEQRAQAVAEVPIVCRSCPAQLCSSGVCTTGACALAAPVGSCANGQCSFGECLSGDCVSGMCDSGGCASGACGRGGGGRFRLFGRRCR